MSLASLTVTERRHHFLSELVWCIRQWPELSAKKHFLSLTSGKKPVTKKYLLNPHFPQTGFNSLVSPLTCHSTYSSSVLLSEFLTLLSTSHLVLPLSKPSSRPATLSPQHTPLFFSFFYLMLCPVILARVCVCHLHNLNYSLIYHPRRRLGGSALNLPLHGRESALQESSSSTGHGLPGGLDEAF